MCRFQSQTPEGEAEVLSLLVHSSQLFGTVLGGGSIHCSQYNNHHSPSECGPLGIQSPAKADLGKGTEKSYWWNATNVKLEFSMENIVANLLVIPKQFFLLFKYLYSLLDAIVYTLVLPCFYGLLMVLFSWLLVYYDSIVPGVLPPTPVSPKKHRMQSGHTFHLGYLLGLINGIIVFGITLWQQVMH